MLLTDGKTVLEHCEHNRFWDRVLKKTDFSEKVGFLSKWPFPLQVPALHRKLQRKLKNLIRNWTSQWLNWSYGLDVIIFHGPLAVTGLHVQHVSLPSVPMMHHNSTKTQKTTILIKKAQSLRKRMDHLLQTLTNSLIWHGNQLPLPCFHLMPPKNLQYSQSILITKAFSGCTPKEMRLSCWHWSPFICPMVSSVSLPFLSPQRLQKAPDRQGRGKELWVLGGKSEYKNP